MRSLTLWAIRAYQAALSPYVGGRCRFSPSCSGYVHEAISAHGVAWGMWLGARRLARCRPFGGRGYDPVPLP